jgi:hypothetical protein
VAGVVTRTNGALTYVDVAYSLTNKPKFMKMRNAWGFYMLPGLRQINAAVKDIKDEKIPASNEMHIVNPPKEKGTKFAYPICTFTYVILPKKTDKAAMLKRFVNYAINPTQGQKFGPPLLFAPLPVRVQVAGVKTLAGAVPDRQLEGFENRSGMRPRFVAGPVRKIASIGQNRAAATSADAGIVSTGHDDVSAMPSGRLTAACSACAP